eukprot:6470324-Amphidinium_carterae.1
MVMSKECQLCMPFGGLTAVRQQPQGVKLAVDNASVSAVDALGGVTAVRQRPQGGARRVNNDSSVNRSCHIVRVNCEVEVDAPSGVTAVRQRPGVCRCASGGMTVECSALQLFIVFSFPCHFVGHGDVVVVEVEV